MGMVQTLHRVGDGPEREHSLVEQLLEHDAVASMPIMSAQSKIVRGGLVRRMPSPLNDVDGSMRRHRWTTTSGISETHREAQVRVSVGPSSASKTTAVQRS
jgi:hypothetical protein